MVVLKEYIRKLSIIYLFLMLLELIYLFISRFFSVFKYFIDDAFFNDGLHSYPWQYFRLDDYFILSLVVVIPLMIYTIYFLQFKRRNESIPFSVHYINLTSFIIGLILFLILIYNGVFICSHSSDWFCGLGISLTLTSYFTIVQPLLFVVLLLFLLYGYLKKKLFPRSVSKSKVIK